MVKGSNLFTLLCIRFCIPTFRHARFKNGTVVDHKFSLSFKVSCLLRLQNIFLSQHSLYAETMVEAIYKRLRPVNTSRK